MGRWRVLWWVLVGIGLAGAVALTTAIHLFDATPSHLLFAALPAFAVALRLARGWLKDGSSPDDSRPDR